MLHSCYGCSCPAPVRSILGSNYRLVHAVQRSQGNWLHGIRNRNCGITANAGIRHSCKETLPIVGRMMLHLRQPRLLPEHGLVFHAKNFLLALIVTVPVVTEPGFIGQAVFPVISLFIPPGLTRESAVAWASCIRQSSA
jgi:hypothetical protein